MSVHQFAFITINLIKAWLQYTIYIGNPNDSTLLYWFTSFDFLSSTSLVIFGLTVDIHNPIIRFLINRIGKYTFQIYLIHLFVVYKINTLGISSNIYNRLSTALPDPIENGLYSAILITIVLWGSLTIVLILRGMVLIANKVLRNLFGRER